MARHFYFKEEVLRHNKQYGYNTVQVSVYHILKDKQPSLVTRFEYRTGATPGTHQLVLEKLADEEVIPSKYSKKNNSDYYKQSVIKIHQLW